MVPQPAGPVIRIRGTRPAAGGALRNNSRSRRRGCTYHGRRQPNKKQSQSKPTATQSQKKARYPLANGLLFMSPINTIADAAAEYFSRGWKPVPVNRKTKKAIGKKWHERDYEPRQFNGNAQNVAVQLGAVSGGLCDVDLDTMTAIGLAPEFLPATGAVFGRNSKPCSHQLYISNLCNTEHKATLAFNEYVGGKPGPVIVELRVGADGKGAATVLPPSMHVTGEIVGWVTDGKPAQVAGDVLKRAVLKLAVTVLLQPHYPSAVGSRHGAALVLGGVLARAGWTTDDIAHVVKVLARNAHDDEIDDRINAACSAVDVKANGHAVPGRIKFGDVWGKDAADTITRWLDRQDGGNDPRQTIVLHSGRLHELASDAETALIAADTPFYTRGGEIVRPIVEEVAAFKGRRTKVARLKSVTVDMMRDYLSRAVRFERWDSRAKQMAAADPPPDLAKIILARDGDWRFRQLTGIITTPTLRPDGSILAQPGYDPVTRLLLITPPPMPAMPEQPSHEEALAALAILDQLLDDFPFVDKINRSVALSALMTPVARGAMQVVPLHVFDAPEAGSGKSYLIDIVSAIATGEIAPVIAAGRNEEETEKRLAAELMTGQPIISIDNLNGDLGGDFICQAIERPTIKPRVLGRSENRRIENTVSMFGNGNNIRLVGDVVRRVIRCSLDANMERPELRQFRGDPVMTVLGDRGAYIAAVLTIVRAYLAAGCPNFQPLASFNDWSRLIRSSLIWLGCEDPLKTMEAARNDDPSRANLRAVVAAWLSVIGPNKPMTTGDLREAACSISNDGGDMALNKAIAAVACAPGRSEIDPVRLGRWLARNKGRVVDQHKIIGANDGHSKQVLWYLEKRTNEKTQ